jgi:mono/diheme cytochrome c family protein
MRTTETKSKPGPKLVGVLAQYAGPDELLSACEHVRDAGYKDFDSYTPFPVHGIDDAMGIKRTKLPFFVLAVGLLGCVGAIGLQWFTNGTDDIGPFEGYKYMISGKPYFSLPANVPVIFEVTVLLSAFAAFFGMWALNRLPRLSNPLSKSEKFRRATNDGFFLMINETDSKFRKEEVTRKLQEWGAVHLEDCIDDLDKELPPIFRTVAVLVFFALLIPPVLIYRAHYGKNDLPRMHFNPDMDRQYKYKEQVTSPIVDGKFLFADTRAARPPVPGSIARGELPVSTEYDRGYRMKLPLAGSPSLVIPATLVSAIVQVDGNVKDPSDGQPAPDGAAPAPLEEDWITEFPLPVSQALIERGQQRFNIYCVVCHGYAGDGNGRVAERAKVLNLEGKATWVAPKSLHDPAVLSQPIGRIFDTISKGRGAMGPYGAQITPEDRWAIVLYVKALQKTRNFTDAEVSGQVKWEEVPFIGPKPAEEANKEKEKEGKSGTGVKEVPDEKAQADEKATSEKKADDEKSKANEKAADEKAGADEKAADEKAADEKAKADAKAKADEQSSADKKAEAENKATKD